jgi:hypothetical protein
VENILESSFKQLTEEEKHFVYFQHMQWKKFTEGPMDYVQGMVNQKWARSVMFPIYEHVQFSSLQNALETGRWLLMSQGNITYYVIRDCV